MLDPGLADAVAEAFELGADARLTGPVAAGRLGRVWRLVTARGRFAVKDFTGPVDRGGAERDASFQDRLHAAGVPMPPVLRTSDGAVLADVAGPVRAYGWVDVLPADRRLDPAAVGRTLAAVHAVAVPADEPVEGWYADPVPRRTWEELVGRLERAGAPFAGRLGALVPELVDVTTVLAPPHDVRTCHRDLWADNVRGRPEGGLVVLDWENSGPADPAQELAVVLFEFGCGDVTRMRRLLAAYAEAGGAARVATEADLTMLVAQTHHIARTACERWLAATTDEQRADNASWAAEFLDEPVTAGTVDLVLAAAR